MVLSDAITHIKEDKREQLERQQAKLEAEYCSLVLQLRKQDGEIRKKMGVLRKEIGQVADKLIMEIYKERKVL